tara:strand:+ start:819 stop:1559 length:741 start_codon:yes stop_codon:yes gene_type:complete
MILRSITEHVKQQNWFAVVLDFLIVVVGILIAFQITSWNESRQDRHAEQRYLAELARDLEADIVEIQTAKRLSLSSLAISELVLETSAPDYKRPSFWPVIEEEVAPEESLLQYPYSALVTRPYLISTNSTFEELIQSGSISVLSNRTLVSDLTKFYKDLRENTNDEKALHNQTNITMNYFNDLGIGLGDSATLDTLQALAIKDTQFLGRVKSIAFFSNWQYLRLNRIESDAATLLSTINAEREDKL